MHHVASDRTQKRRLWNGLWHGGRAGWEDAYMSENTQSGSNSPASGGEEEHAPGPGQAHPRTPTTQPMRTVGQRRRDSEKKLDNHQRGARTKPAD